MSTAFIKRTPDWSVGIVRGRQRSQNGRPHSVPLNEAALNELQRKYSTTQVTRSPVNEIPSSSSTSRLGALRCCGPIFKIFAGTTCDTLLQHGTGKPEHLGTPTLKLQRLGGWKTQSMVER